MWTNQQKTADLLTFTKEILNEKLPFLCTTFEGALLPKPNVSYGKIDLANVCDWVQGSTEFKVRLEYA